MSTLEIIACKAFKAKLVGSCLPIIPTNIETLKRFADKLAKR